jgi:hypothetical protein
MIQLDASNCRLVLVALWHGTRTSKQTNMLILVKKISSVQAIHVTFVTRTLTKRQFAKLPSLFSIKNTLEKTIVRKSRRKHFWIGSLMICFPLLLDKVMIVLHCRVSRRHVISALSAGHSCAVHGVQTWGYMGVK